MESFREKGVLLSTLLAKISIWYLWTWIKREIESALELIVQCSLSLNPNVHVYTFKGAKFDYLQSSSAVQRPLSLSKLRQKAAAFSNSSFRSACRRSSCTEQFLMFWLDKAAEEVWYRLSPGAWHFFGDIEHDQYVLKVTILHHSNLTIFVPVIHSELVSLEKWKNRERNIFPTFQSLLVQWDIIKIKWSLRSDVWNS